MTEFRIDELARAAGVTVRNVRAYQDKGLLPPPRLQGRVGIYDDSHLARLRLIADLLSRGYTLAVIGELMSAWEDGRDLSDVLGVEQAVIDPWSDERPASLPVDEVMEMYGLTGSDPALVGAFYEEAERQDFLHLEGDRYIVPSPLLLHVGAELVASGVPLDRVLELSAQVRQDCLMLARRFVELVMEHGHIDPDTLMGREDLPELAGLIRRLRPLAHQAVEGHLTRAMEEAARARFGDVFVAVLRRSED